MQLFGQIKTTIVCPRVVFILGKLQIDDTPVGHMFKIMLREWGLSWKFEGNTDFCNLEGSWEALLKGFTVFSAIQNAEIEVIDDINLLFTWCRDYCANITHIPIDANDKILLHSSANASTKKKSDPSLPKQTDYEPYDRVLGTYKQNGDVNTEDLEIDKQSEPDENFTNQSQTLSDDDDNHEDNFDKVLLIFLY